LIDVLLLIWFNLRTKICSVSLNREDLAFQWWCYNLGGWTTALFSGLVRAGRCLRTYQPELLKLYIHLWI